MEPGFTFIGRAADGGSPTVASASGDNLNDLLGRAQAFLREHRSCQLVEVWRGEICLAKMEGPPAVQ